MEIDLNKYNSLLEAYKKDFKNLIKLELYKWKDIKHFQAHWDIDAENFVRKSRSKDGFSTKCKKCDRADRERKKVTK